MPDIIQLLPDSVANQIAAGEVIQRPASVVKELTENAIDSGADTIKIILKDAGRTLIQVIDNGCGMTDTDARMAFERHATSKITSADDLFKIQTKGFRGEALASIAAIAHTELKTRLLDEDLGTSILIEGSEFIKQDVCSCPSGSNFLIKNLFYNVPARRKFLKSNSTELKHIIDEVQRVAFAHPEIAIQLVHNDYEIFNLPIGNLKQRLVNIIGKNRDQYLIKIHNETSIIKIEGFIGKPEYAKKTSGEQFFFVNKRFIKHPGFYKAVMDAYEGILPKDLYPSFFIYFTVDPSTIDINIHPTKTEVKFEEERAIWQIIKATVKESLGKYNIVPSLDFNTEASFEIPPMSGNRAEVRPPEISHNPEYNPFNAPQHRSAAKSAAGWEALFETVKNTENDFQETRQTAAFSAEEQVQQARYVLQLRSKYIVTPVKSGLMMIDQRRAHERILYEKFLITITNQNANTQLSLYPQTMELSPSDFEILMGLNEEISLLGFSIDVFGKNAIVINGIPADLVSMQPVEALEKMLEGYKADEPEVGAELNEVLARSLAKSACIEYGKKLSDNEMRDLIDSLFTCSVPNFTAEGKKVIEILRYEDMEERFK